MDNSNHCASALQALAEHVRERAYLDQSIVVKGPRSLTLTEKKDRQQLTEDLAMEIDKLDETVPQGTLNYDKHVAPILSKLHAVGITPESLLVSEVARVLNEA